VVGVPQWPSGMRLRGVVAAAAQPEARRVLTRCEALLSAGRHDGIGVVEELNGELSRHFDGLCIVLRTAVLLVEVVMLSVTHVYAMCDYTHVWVRKLSQDWRRSWRSLAWLWLPCRPICHQACLPAC
jgi:hypothetical protein